MSGVEEGGIYKEHLAESVILGKRLGRHVLHDPKSRQYVAEQATAIKEVSHNLLGLPLDQGNIGSCTANALVGALNWDKDLKGKTPRTESDAVNAYEVETKMEGQPYPPNDPGGTGVYVCKAGESLGWVRGYTHTFSITAALKALVVRPGMVGANWYTTFDHPAKDGLVSIGRNASVRGGHEFVAYAVSFDGTPSSLTSPTDSDLHKIYVHFWNSWSDQYGDKGKFYMTAATLNQLFSEQGDYTVPLAKF